MVNKRVKLIREAVSMTQQAFADQLGISRNFVAQIEMGTKIPSDRTIADMCRVFNVREEWLRTGEGEPFAPAKVANDIAGFIEAALSRQPEVDRQLLIDKITGMSEAEIVVLAELLGRMFP